MRQAVAVSESGSSQQFDEWLLRISFNPEAPADDPGEVSAAWRRWMRRFFDEHGAVTPEVVTKAAEAHQLALANEAASAVLADVYSVTSLRPTVVVDAHDHGIRIAIDGGYTSPSMWEVDAAAAFSEVADYFQEQLGSECWPVCGQHHVGLHAEVRDGRAVWWCRVGNHPVARVGELGETT